jgi:hypothetical protein
MLVLPVPSNVLCCGPSRVQTEEGGKELGNAQSKRKRENCVTTNFATRALHRALWVRNLEWVLLRLNTEEIFLDRLSHKVNCILLDPRARENFDWFQIAKVSFQFSHTPAQSSAL